eukprot:3031264-Heterocapsa_arctica.AAC.1
MSLKQFSLPMEFVSPENKASTYDRSMGQGSFQPEAPRRKRGSRNTCQRVKPTDSSKAHSPATQEHSTHRTSSQIAFSLAIAE